MQFESFWLGPLGRWQCKDLRKKNQEEEQLGDEISLKVMYGTNGLIPGCIGKFLLTFPH